LSSMSYIRVHVVPYNDARQREEHTRGGGGVIPQQGSHGTKPVLAVRSGEWKVPGKGFTA
jgi:hypothetical protein